MPALMYHDVVPAGAESSSGFPGRDAALYKVTPDTFEAHLAAITDRTQRRGALTLTFDDGGVSAMTTAEMLERYRLIGHFFVTVNYLGTPGFLTHGQLRTLRKRGHEIGSHSCSHPLRMGHCPPDQLLDEWRRSRAALTDALGEEVTAGSVPGGDFAPAVAEAAAAAGFTRLFTSEPTVRPRTLHQLTIHGRFTIQRWTSPGVAAALAAGEPLPCAAQAFLWNVKKLGKAVGGSRYLQLRRFLIRHGSDVRWGDQR